jgi:hypothetical protein
MTSRRKFATATLLPNGRVLVVGGQRTPIASGALDTAELFDPAGGAFTATGSLAVARFDHHAVALADGRVLILGGIDAKNQPVRQVEIYDPATGMFTVNGELTLPEGRRVETATVLPDGRIVVTASGETPDRAQSVTNSVEVYDPAIGKSKAIGALATPRRWYQAVLLPDGRVLVAGGMKILTRSTADWLDSAELIDPTAGTVTDAEPMTRPRVNYAVVQLPDGRPLFLGGETGGGPGDVLNLNVEVYTP